MKKNPLYCVLIIAILSIFIFGCTSSDSGSDDGNECDGPVPCLTTDWNDSEYWFEEANGNPVLVISDGDVFAVAGYTDDGHIISVGGLTTNCYNGNLSEGAVDWNDNGALDDDEWLSSVAGNVNICDKTLTISNLVIEGSPEGNVVASYLGVDLYAADNDFRIESEILMRTLLDGIKRMDAEQ